MSTDSILFQDIFDIKDIDPQGKHFDRGKTTFSLPFLQ
jgi:DNA-directed RNA polymerase I, II, and III subunit RPABC3